MGHEWVKTYHYLNYIKALGPIFKNKYARNGCVTGKKYFQIFTLGLIKYNHLLLDELGCIVHKIKLKLDLMQ